MFNLIKKITRIIIIQAKIMASFLLKLTNGIFKVMGLELLPTSQLTRLKKESTAIINFYLQKDELNEGKNKLRKAGVSAIIFSFDRALQLHALLGSIKEKTSEPFPIFIIYRSSTTNHLMAYQELREQVTDENVKFIHQKESAEFPYLLINVLETIETEKIFFLVDDIIWTEEVDINEIKEINSQKDILSLRLGTNLDYAYTIDKQQPLPEFTAENNKIYWNWAEAKYDWNYPLSVDGHIFLTTEILGMVKNIDFHSPNTLEGGLQIFKPLFEMRGGIAYKKSRIVNIPCNKVQTDINNRYGKTNVDDLLKKWQAGYQIDYQKFYGLNNKSCHQEIDLSFIPRKI